MGVAASLEALSMHVWSNEKGSNLRCWSDGDQWLA